MGYYSDVKMVIEGDERYFGDDGYELAMLRQTIDSPYSREPELDVRSDL